MTSEDVVQRLRGMAQADLVEERPGIVAFTTELAKQLQDLCEETAQTIEGLRAKAEAESLR